MLFVMFQEENTQNICSSAFVSPQVHITYQLIALTFSYLNNYVYCVFA